MPVRNPKSHITSTLDPSADAKTSNASEVEEIASRIKLGLTNATPALSVSARAVTVLLRPSIREARRNGLSWKKIAEVYEKEGVVASPDSIRVYTSVASPTRAARAQMSSSSVTAGPAVKSSVEIREGRAAADNAAPVPARRDGAAIARRIK